MGIVGLLTHKPVPGLQTGVVTCCFPSGKLHLRNQEQRPGRWKNQRSQEAQASLAELAGCAGLTGLCLCPEWGS